MKKVAPALFVLLILASCVSQQAIIASTPTNEPRPSATFTVQPTLTVTPYILNLTPEITATPVFYKSDAQDIDQIIGDIYGIPPACNHPDTEMQGKPEFTDITKKVRLDQLFIDEIAESEHKTYRAYLVEESVPEVCNACFRTRVYSMKIATGQIYMVSWSGYQGARILFRMIWIGDKILAFEQSLNPHVGEIIAVDVEKQSFVYHGISYEFCK